MLIQSFFPNVVVENSELENDRLTAEKIYNKTGIKARRVAEPGETALSLAEKAGHKLLKQLDDTASVNALLYCTQSPDYIIPNNVSILHDRLQLNVGIPTIEYSQGCSGYVYGLYMAKSMIVGGGVDNVLLVTADTYAKYLQKDNYGCRTIFGDGATATLVTKNDALSFGEFCFGTDGSHHKALYLKGEGAQTRNEDMDLFMNGPEIFCFTLEVVPKIIKEALEKNNCHFEDIDHFVFHQANGFMLEALRKRVGIPKEKFHQYFEEFGNTVSSTIPIVLEHMFGEKKVKKGDKILLCAFGVGLSWNAVIMNV